jgi:hypothetical protein
MQTLSPFSQTKRETFIDIDSYFGGRIASTSSTLVVGCQNCNSSETTPQKSGEVYVYTPSPTRSFWTASQILTADTVTFLGEHVALHAELIVATGDAPLSLGTSQSIADFPTRAVIFQRPPPAAAGKERDGVRGGYSQLQVLTVPNPTSYTISEIAVYDETIALSASKYSQSLNPNEIYIYYPSTPRFGRGGQSSGPKGKSKAAVQWSLHQTLNNLGSTFVLNFYLSIQGNNLVYSSFHATKDQVILYKRYSLTGQWEHSAVSGVDVFEANGGTYDLFATLTPDQKLYFVNLGATTAPTLFKPIDLNPSSFHCLEIFVGDHFGDGWDSAVLTMEAPSGHKVSYAPACDTYNPISYRYCPFSSDDRGVYKLRVEHVQEASFSWEIMWKVYDERTREWYFGTHATEMDFEWSERFTDFTARRMEHLHLNVTACAQCALLPRAHTSAKPKPKPQSQPSLKHLRSLHGKSVTTSPTMSPAPTIEVTGLEPSSSLYFKMSNAASDTSTWFDSENSGTNYYISDVKGKKLFQTGTACTNGVSELSCWVELPDGDYLARVGGALDASVNRQWKFCGGIHYQAKQTELYFSVEYGVCTPSLARSHANVCNNVLKVTTLYIEIQLLGDFSLSHSLASGASQEIKSFIDRFLSKTLGHVSVSLDVTSTAFTDSSALVGVLVGLSSLGEDEASVLVSVLKDSSLVGLEKSTLALHGVHGIEAMSLQSIKYFDEMEDMQAIDESSFHLITDFVTGDMAADGVLDENEIEFSSSSGKMNYFQFKNNWYVFGSAGVTLAILFAVVFFYAEMGGSSSPTMLPSPDAGLSPDKTSQVAAILDRSLYKIVVVSTANTTTGTPTTTTTASKPRPGSVDKAGRGRGKKGKSAKKMVKKLTVV